MAGREVHLQLAATCLPSLDLLSLQHGMSIPVASRRFLPEVGPLFCTPFFTRVTGILTSVLLLARVVVLAAAVPFFPFAMCAVRFSLFFAFWSLGNRSGVFLFFATRQHNLFWYLPLI